MVQPIYKRSTNRTSSLVESGPSSSSLEAKLLLACQIAATGAVADFHLSISERPTYATLAHYRQIAEESGLTLTLSRREILLQPIDHAVDSSSPQRNRIAIGHLISYPRRWSWLRLRLNRT